MATLKLPRLTPGAALVDDSGKALGYFLRYWDTVLTALENAINDVVTAQATATLALAESLPDELDRLRRRIDALEAQSAAQVVDSGSDELRRRVQDLESSVAVGGTSDSDQLRRKLTDIELITMGIPV